MIRRVAIASLALSVLAGCAAEQPPATTDTTTTPPPTSEPIEVVMAPVAVGTRTPDYEVISPTELTLARGVRLEVIEGADGQVQGFVLRRNDGGLGGFMACGCVGATISSCKTENDNPEHPSCSGSCVDSEGNSHPCQIEGPIIGPPKDPYRIRFVAQ